MGEEISLECIRQSAIQLLRDRHSDMPNNTNEPVKHAARDVRHSWKGTRAILFIHGAEVVRGIETKWQGSAGPGRGRGNWCSNGSFNPGRWECPGDGRWCLQACTLGHVTVHIAHTCAPPPSLLAHL